MTNQPFFEVVETSVHFGSERHSRKLSLWKKDFADVLCRVQVGISHGGFVGGHNVKTLDSYQDSSIINLSYSFLSPISEKTKKYFVVSWS